MALNCRGKVVREEARGYYLKYIESYIINFSHLVEFSLVLLV
jgi:hypothetical protein